MIPMSFLNSLALHFICNVGLVLFSEDLLGKIWCWERLVMPPDSSVKWSDYSSYLEAYYERNASGFVAAAAAAKNPQKATITDMGAAVAKFVSNPLASLLNHR
jgi:hypothetical protein